jgi:hypothetical protein
VLLIAPQPTEFGAKVGLLAGLTLLSPTRYLLDRLVGPETTSFTRRITTSRGAVVSPGVLLTRGAVIGSITVLIASAVVIAGIPARTAPVLAASGAVDIEIDAALIPAVTVADDVADIVPDVGDGSALALVLVENLAVEAQAMTTGDVTMLLSVDIGDRLAEIEAIIDAAASDGIRVATHHHLDSLHLRLMPNDGSQAGAALAFDATGTTETITYDATGIETARTTQPLDTTFVLRQGPARWMNAHQLP